MKKIAVLTIACSVLAGCSYLGQPESYTVIDEDVAPVAAQPAPVVQQPVAAPVVAPAPVRPSCGCGYVRPCCSNGACQLNPGVAGPLVIEIPAQSVCIQ